MHMICACHPCMKLECFSFALLLGFLSILLMEPLKLHRWAVQELLMDFHLPVYSHAPSCISSLICGLPLAMQLFHMFFCSES